MINIYIIYFSEDHLVKTQAMRGSPYFKPFEKEVLGWESQLIRIEECIKAWLEVQKKWLYMESMFGVEEIVRQLPNENALFKEVDHCWKSIMDSIAKDPRVLVTAGEVGMLEDLNKSLETLKKVGTGVSQYVDDKKIVFPRFFFMSNLEILTVLAETKDPTRVSPYCQKIFEGINRLEFNEMASIQAMISPTEERVPFTFPIHPREAKGCVEKWLTELENQMYGTLQQLVVSAKDAFANTKQTTWLKGWPTQVILAVQHYLWTTDLQEAIKGGEQALREQSAKLANDIASLIEYLGSKNLSKSVAIGAKSLITQQLYFKEVTDKIYNDRITSENDFSWSSQIKMHLVENELQLSMFNVKIPYRYEYIGSIRRLVMTPSTKQGMITILQAFNAHYNAGITGPCDVGKSSLAKELAAYIGTMYRTFVGSERNSIYSISNFLSGVASSGCWAILEDLDRSSSEMMSFISIFLDKLRECNTKKKTSITVDSGQTIPIESGFFFLLTSHRNYRGRRKIPESLKVLFRPVSFLQPDTSNIVKCNLISHGFDNFDEISVKMTDFASLFKSQFSMKTKYHFGLRRIEVIIQAAGKYIRGKKLSEEAAIVKSITEDLFPTFDDKGSAALKHILKSVFHIEMDNIEESNDSQAKMVRVCNAMLDHYQSVIIIGAAYSGKTTILKMVQKERGVDVVAIINPKCMSSDHFFGSKSKGVWKNGLLSETFKKISLIEKEKWVIFDGPLDHRWIENLNCSIDFKQIFYFDSGEAVNFSHDTKTNNN